MQTMTSSYARGRSPFTRLRRNVRRQTENIRAWEYADWQLARWRRIDPTDRPRLDELETDRKRQADNITRFQQVLIDTYGPYHAERIRRVAISLA